MAEADFDTMINYFRSACVKNDIKKSVIVNFLDWLESQKDELCLKVLPDNKRDTKSGKGRKLAMSRKSSISMSGKSSMSSAVGQDQLIESVEQQHKF